MFAEKFNLGVEFFSKSFYNEFGTISVLGHYVVLPRKF